MGEVAERAHSDREVGPSASFFTPHKASRSQNLQMMAHGRLAETERFGEVADTHFTVRRDEAHQSKPRRIAESLEPNRHVLSSPFCKGGFSYGRTTTRAIGVVGHVKTHSFRPQAYIDRRRYGLPRPSTQISDDAGMIGLIRVARTKPSSAIGSCQDKATLMSPSDSASRPMAG